MLSPKFTALVLAVATSMLPLLAHASVQVLQHEDRRSAPAEVYISGEITPDLPDTFLRVLQSNAVERATIYFDSDGGDVIAGMELGEIIRKAGFNTSVGKMGSGYGQASTGRCQSSCVLSFLGGYFRFAEPGSIFGIHRFYKATASELDLDVGQVLSASITGYLIRMDVDPSLFERMVQVGRGRMQRLSLTDAKALNVVNNGILPATWSIEGVNGRVYLQGSQEAWTGAGRLIVHCPAPGQVELTAMYDAGSNTQQIARSVDSYSVRLDGRFANLGEQHILSRHHIHNGYLAVKTRLTAPMAQSITEASRVGFAFHPATGSTFYGFLVDSSADRELIRSYLAHCNR